MARATIALIGAGQIGSRHLQSLARLGRNADIFIIDPSEQSLETAAERYAEVAHAEPDTAGRRLFPSKKYEDLPGTIDVAIVATTADRRLDAIRSLFDRSAVKNVILEKVVFQRSDDFDAAERIFDNHKTNVWVNCPRRFWPGYIAVKEHFSRYDHLLTSMMVTGSNWGLCCNSIHFLDLYLFVTGHYQVTLSGDQLDPRIIPSKRPGIIELSGTLYGFDPAGNQVLFRDYGMPADIPLQLAFENPQIRCLVDETAGTVRIAECSNAWKWVELPLQVVFQSQLTQVYIEQILATATCDLPTFAESTGIHKSLLSVLTDHLEKVTGTEVPSCPIT
jgi:hypothetical protein